MRYFVYLAIVFHLFCATAHADSGSAGNSDNMVLVPAGWFKMGWNAGEPDERPEHRVWLDAFWIDKYEITNTQFSEYLNKAKIKLGPSRLKNPAFGINYNNGKFVPKHGVERHPVVFISHKEAFQYCEFYGKRLPSEAQWEKACRAGNKKRPYPPADKNLQKRANVHHWWHPFPSPVGSYPPNAYGIADMEGNVGEFCSDAYQPHWYRGSPSKNPACTKDTPSSKRVVRGGSFSFPLSLCRCGYRRYMSARSQDMNEYTGFRCVLPVKGPGK
jgi:formylglycine-generating enzyme required for sulfatase activity